MEKVAYFFRRNVWVFNLVLVLMGIVFCVTFWGSIILWIIKGVMPAKWLICLVISIVAMLISGTLLSVFDSDAFCKKCGRTGIVINSNPPYSEHYCNHCGNAWSSVNECPPPFLKEVENEQR